MSAPDLRVDLGRGLVMANPVGLASGTAGYGFELRQLIDLERVGALFTKGTTLHAREGNPPPRVAEVRGGMLNSIGLHNPGVEHVASVYAPEFASWSIPVVVNVAGGSVDDYLRCLERLDAVTGVAGYELNISCPNIANGLDYGRDPEAAARLVAAARERTARHLMVKLSPNVTDIAAVARAVEDAGADSVSAVNTYVGMKVHRGIRAPVLPGAAGAERAGDRAAGAGFGGRGPRRRRIPVLGVGGIRGPRAGVPDRRSRRGPGGDGHLRGSRRGTGYPPMGRWRWPSGPASPGWPTCGLPRARRCPCRDRTGITGSKPAALPFS